ANPAVVKPSQQQVKPYPNVRYIGERNQDFATRFEQLAHAFQYIFGIADVFENIAQNNCIVATQAFEIQSFDIPNQHLLAILPSDTSHIRVLFYAGYLAAKL